MASPASLSAATAATATAAATTPLLQQVQGSNSTTTTTKTMKTTTTEEEEDNHNSSFSFSFSWMFSFSFCVLWLWNILVWIFFGSVVVMTCGLRQLYIEPIADLVESYQRLPDNTVNRFGFYPHLNHQITYYNRQCTGPEDITTMSNNDLMVPVHLLAVSNNNETNNTNTNNNETTSMSMSMSNNHKHNIKNKNEKLFAQQVVDISMTHGAVLIPKVLSKSVAQGLRDYLEITYHDQLDQIPYSANFWSEMDRLSLGLTIDDDDEDNDPNDHNEENDNNNENESGNGNNNKNKKQQHQQQPSSTILLQALHQVGTNPVVQQTLEAILGPNLAIVEISTLTTMYGAQPQNIHTDSDFFGSSLLYSRSFLHSYTMFMALQDTTPLMGATTVCPGTHMCANEDLEWLCGDDSPYAFEASSNGQTGKHVGLFHQGDAFLFNQNVWHRGPANYDVAKNPNTNRVMFIMTFVSRRDYDSVRDVRQLGWGTYYYMRWDQWGHSYQDLKDAAQRFTTTTMKSIMKNIFKMIKSSLLSFFSSWWNYNNNNDTNTIIIGGGLRALGLTTTKQHQQQQQRNMKNNNNNNNHNLMGYTWVEHFCRQLATREDFYAKWELPAFKDYIKELLSSLSSLSSIGGFDIGKVLENRLLADTQRIMNFDLYFRKVLDNAMEFVIEIQTFIWEITVIVYLVMLVVSFVMTRKRNKRGTTTMTTTATKKSTTTTSPTMVIGGALFQLIIGKVVIIGIAYGTYHYIMTQSYLGQRITKGIIWDEPFPNPTTTTNTNDEEERNIRTRNNNILPTTFPERMDVLIGSRFDAEFLASFNHFLEYHPGNKYYNGWITKFAKSFPFNIDIAIQGMEQVWMTQPIQNVVPRMLLQDYQTGDWLLMPENDDDDNKDTMMTTTIRSMIRKHLMAEQSKQIKILWTHLKQVLADSRFGHGRETIMKQIFVPKLVQYWEDVLFSPQQQQQNNNDNNNNDNGKKSSRLIFYKPQNHRHRHRHDDQPTTIPTSSSLALFANKTIFQRTIKTTTTTTTPVTCSHLLRQGDISKTIHLQSRDLSIVQEGDRVLVRHLEAVVRHIFDNDNEDDDDEGEYCLIQFVLDGSIAEVSADELHPYVPLVEGDIIQAPFYENNNNNHHHHDPDWYLAKIIHASPFGNYDIEWFEVLEDEPSKEYGLIRTDLRLLNFNNIHEVENIRQVLLEYGSGDVDVDVETYIPNVPTTVPPFMKLLRQQSRQQQEPLNIHQTVYVNYFGEGRWFPGRIVQVYPHINNDDDNEDEDDDNITYTYSIRYDDGDYEEHVPIEHLIPMYMSPLLSSSSSSSSL